MMLLLPSSPSVRFRNDVDHSDTKRSAIGDPEAGLNRAFHVVGYGHDGKHVREQIFRIRFDPSGESTDRKTAEGVSVGTKIEVVIVLTTLSAIKGCALAEQSSCGGVRTSVHLGSVTSIDGICDAITIEAVVSE